MDIDFSHLSALPSHDPVIVAIIKRRYNFRDISTFAPCIKPGLMYRSGILAGLDDSHKDFFKSLALRTVVDLRSDVECMTRRACVPRGAKYVRLPIFTEPIMKKILDFPSLFECAKKTGSFSVFRRKSDFMVLAYKEILSVHTEIFSQFFQLIMDPSNLPLVFHCNAGKDRTGIISALFFSLLEVPQEDIFREYLFTNAMLGDLRPKYELVVKDYVIKYGIFTEETFDMEECAPAIELMLNWATVKREYLNAIFEEIEQSYGNVDNFLCKVLKIKEHQRNLIQCIFLTDISNELSPED
eukprot:TRINITY_DN11518_c0_g1_i1.p1 TRINITY_DN11518_c0_g1~~TRINITY_DN11518_c0_g1_i1.p1  ORF type:complete len:298 (-),score=41.38 TRINITY_DN11518_c0_g1_i1:46-939(-)